MAKWLRLAFMTSVGFAIGMGVATREWWIASAALFFVFAFWLIEDWLDRKDSDA